MKFGFLGAIKGLFTTSYGKGGSKLADNHPPTFTPNYIHRNGQVMTILEFKIKDGTNRDIEFGGIADLIPRVSNANIKAYWIRDNSIVTGEARDNLIKENSVTMRRTTQRMRDEKDDDKTANEDKKKNVKIEDYTLYEYNLDNKFPIVGFNMNLILIGQSEKELSDQIETININLDNLRDGFSVTSIPTEQIDKYMNFGDRYLVSPEHFSSTAQNYTGINSWLNNGLTDEAGIPIGLQSYSHLPSTEYFDFNSHTKTKAFISINRTEKMMRYSNVSTSSVLAQAAANQIVMSDVARTAEQIDEITREARKEKRSLTPSEQKDIKAIKASGVRAHHIIFNDFDYSDNSDKSGFIKLKQKSEIFEFIDMSKKTVNPLEGFGEREEVKSIFSELKRKIINIFDVMTEYQLDPNSRSIILDTLDEFYHKRSLHQVGKEERSGIIGIKDKEAYPKMSTYLQDFVNAATRIANANNISRLNSIENLQSELREALTSYGDQVNKGTNIFPTDKQQIFYNFGSMRYERPKLYVQFLNSFSYIMSETKRGDLVVFHGLDRISQKVFDMVSDVIDRKSESGVRFIYAFDNVSAMEKKDSNMIDCSIFGMKGKMYHDLHTDSDWTIMGSLLEEEVPKFQEALSAKVSLSQQTIKTMQIGGKNPSVLIHRGIDEINDFVIPDVII